MTDLSRMHGFADSAIRALEGRHFRPPLPDGHVSRPRLCERLTAGLSSRLLLVCAPAGFGKSSLAVEFCQQLPSTWRSLWLGLGPRDREPGRFLERLLGGLQQFFPQLGGQAMGLLKRRQRNDAFAYDEWLDGLLDELAMHLMLGRPLLLVIDDYHLAQGPVVDRCLQMLLDHSPAGLVLLVTSRQRPVWHLARLRLARQLVEISEHDLRLTDAESCALLDAHALTMQSEARDDLVRRSEGWAAGLRLWALALGAGDGAVALHDGEESIRDYLLEEVLESLPSPVQAFLYDTACLERFCSELCDMVRGMEDSADLLDYLVAHRLFLVPLDNHNRWFRYHHLLRDLLRARHPDTKRVARLRFNACRWLAEQGLPDEVAGHVSHGALSGLFSLVQSIDLSISQGRCEQAGELLERSLRAAAEGTLSPFRTLLERHPQWCRERLRQATPCPVRDFLLEQLPTAAAHAPAPCSSTLSVRELAVLRLIAQGCSNQEISEQLFISLHTVKSHASHINSKLGVERRTQAVAKAKALGLL